MIPDNTPFQSLFPIAVVNLLASFQACLMTFVKSIIKQIHLYLQIFTVHCSQYFQTAIFMRRFYKILKEFINYQSRHTKKKMRHVDNTYNENYGRGK